MLRLPILREQRGERTNIIGDRTVCDICGGNFHKYGIGHHRKGCLKLRGEWLVNSGIQVNGKSWRRVVGAWGERARERFRRRRLNGYWKEYQTNLRMKVIEKYGGKCATCGIKDFRVLQLDHVKGNGKSDRKKHGSNMALYRFLSVHRRSAQYQILCANCNWIKRVETDGKIGGDERDYRERKACRTARSAANPRRTS